jgi:hypothetical protein
LTTSDDAHDSRRVVAVTEARRPSVVRHPGRVAAGVLTVSLAVAALATARTGPEGRLLVDRPVAAANRQLWGITHWMAIVQIATVAASGVFLGYFLVRSRRNRRLHPALPVLAGLFVMGLLTDSFANWTSSAAMNPDLLHYPSGWWFFDVSPTVEPLVNTVAYPYLFLGPALLVVTSVRRRPVPPRRPRAAVFALTYLIAVPINQLLVNLFMCRIEYWTYTQIPSWAAVRGGTPWQYPWTDPLTLSVLTATTAVLLWRDDHGASTAKKVAVAALITALAYVPYNAVWASFRLTDSGDTLAKPWVYANTKVYDPKGDYARAGVPGPYFRGMWP